MSDPSSSEVPAGPRTSGADQDLTSGSTFTVTRASSDNSSEAEDGDRPASPHFYSLSVRQDSPSLDSYHADTANSASKNLDDYETDDCIKEDLTSDQQVDEQAVKLDLLRREHSQRARQILEQLQTAASTASQRSESPRRSSFGSKRTSSNVSMDLVRQQSEQLKQASGDLKLLAEEQRTLAEEAVANFLLKEDALMMTEGQSKPAGSSSDDAGLSQALNAVFEEQHGTSRNSLTRQMEKIRRAEQAIKDAEADERIADQLAALQLTLSQLADQEESSNPSEDVAGIGDPKPSVHSQGTAPGRAILKNISENSQEGLDSSQGRSSSSQQSQMSASAFAAVSRTNGFRGSHHEDEDAQSEGQADQASLDKDTRSSQDQPAAQDELTAAEAAQAEQQTALHDRHQAQTPDADADAGAKTSQNDAKGAQNSVKTPDSDTAASSHATEASESQPLTESSLTALRLNTDASQSPAQAIPTSASRPDQDPAAGSSAAPASQGSDFAGSVTGSHTFDAELHEGMASLVQAPEHTHTDTADQQPPQPTTSSEADAAGSSPQGLTTGPSSPESTSSQQGAEAAHEAAAADQAPVYSLGSDEEENLAVVSSEDQAREAQASANQFMESTSRPATPDTDVPFEDPPQQAGPPSGPIWVPSDQQQQRDESASDSAAHVSTYTTSEYDRDARMVDAFEPEEFQGMLFHDGVDSQGRPVIVVNTDAVGTTRKARGQALQYMLHRLEPIVVQGPYVLVMVATGQHQKSNKLPAMWLISAYRNLSRPFRKNVRYILLVRPTGGLKALVTCIRPFVSAKAAKKVRKVDSLAAIAAATSNEVTLQHLGSRFAAAAGNYFLEGTEKQSAIANAYDMPHF